MTLVISPEVTAHVGERQAADLLARTTVFTCSECRAAGDARVEDAVAVVRASPELSSLTVAHQRCSDSEVRRCDAGTLQPAALHDLIPRAIAIPSPRGPRPALLLAFEEEVTVRRGDGQEVDPVGEALQAEGLQRLTSLGAIPARSPGWLVRVGPGDALQVDGPGRRHLEEGRMSAPPAWRALVAPSSEVLLLMGRLDLETLMAVSPPLGAYGKAVTEGRLLAGLVPVTLL